jgi:hypothetical protein
MNNVHSLTTYPVSHQRPVFARSDPLKLKTPQFGTIKQPFCDHHIRAIIPTTEWTLFLQLEVKADRSGLSRIFLDLSSKLG